MFGSLSLPLSLSLSLLLCAGVAARNDPPTIAAEGDQLRVDAADMVFNGRDGSEPISIVAMATKLEAMQALLERELAVVKANVSDLQATMSALPTVDAMDEALRAMAAGVTNEVLAVQKKSADAVNARVDDLVNDIAGLPETVKTVGVLALDVDYLLDHADNITACGESNGLHLGDGECVSAVPQCTKPQAPTGGTVVFSSEYFIPGTTATYACAKDSDFVFGPTLRTCRENTKQFDGDEPKCLACKVPNCATCKGAVDTCGKCAFGHGLSPDSKSCKERATSILILGKGHYNAQHEILKPNADEYVALNPSLHPNTPSGGAGALIQGTIYLVTPKTTTYMLKKGASAWTTFAKSPFSRLSTPFYATLSGVSTKEDGFYVFGTTLSAVYQPSSDTWTRLTTIAGGESRSVRNMGGTAVVGNKIYCVGGYASGTGNKHSAEVHYFDATQKTWTKAPSLVKPRHDLAAAAYGAKVFAFGGVTNGNVRTDSAEMLDTSAGSSAKWVAIASLPDAWSRIGNGPMPVFAGGKIIIPGASVVGKVDNSIEYDVTSNTWKLLSTRPRLRKANNNIILWGAYE